MNQPTYPIVSTNRWPDEQSYQPQNTFGKILPLAEIEETDDSVDTIIEGILNKGQIALVSGPSKSGKSFLVSNFSASIASGTEMFGKKCSAGKVLYIELENGAKETKKRIKQIINEKGLDEETAKNIFVYSLKQGFVSEPVLFFDEIIEQIKDNEFSIIIIDPVYMLINGDENSSEVIKAFFKNISHLNAVTDAAIILCHHESKGNNNMKNIVDRAAGSSVLARFPDVLISLELVKNIKSTIGKRAKISMILRYHPSPEPFYTDFHNGVYHMEKPLSTEENKLEPKTKHMLKVYETLKSVDGKVTVNQLKSALNVSSVNTVKKYIDETPGFTRNNKGVVTYTEPEK